MELEKYEEEILKKIDEDVSSNADLIRTQVETENENLHQDQLSFFKEGLKKETDTYLEKNWQNSVSSLLPRLLPIR